jgi:hypothetical protein
VAFHHFLLVPVLSFRKDSRNLLANPPLEGSFVYFLSLLFRLSSDAFVLRYDPASLHFASLSAFVPLDFSKLPAVHVFLFLTHLSPFSNAKTLT